MFLQVGRQVAQSSGSDTLITSGADGHTLPPEVDDLPLKGEGTRRRLPARPGPTADRYYVSRYSDGELGFVAVGDVNLKRVCVERQERVVAHERGDLGEAQRAVTVDGCLEGVLADTVVGE